ncbi:MAG: DUF4367 domain-containing protein [Lachnospiraceae bacterium]|nr:DUF4367 domain-containing protein [Lachnospiraceae bacterium]
MSGKYEFLRNLSTEQLEELLRQTIDEESSDIDCIDSVLEVIAEREKSNSTHLGNVQQAWNDFQRIYNSSDCEPHSLYESAELNENQKPQTKRKLISVLKKVALAAIISSLCLFMIATALGYDVFQVIGHWTNEVFSFMYPPISDISSNISEGQSQEFESLQAALDTNNIDQIKAPTWIPENFVQSNVIVIPHLKSKEIQAYYICEDLSLVMSITEFEETYSFQYEKDENSVEEYEINGITHYLFTNNDKVVATWNINFVECSIHGDITLPDMKKILNSMY